MLGERRRSCFEVRWTFGAYLVALFSRLAVPGPFAGQVLRVFVGRIPDVSGTFPDSFEACRRTITGRWWAFCVGAAFSGQFP